MRCAICKHGETASGLATLSLTRDGCVLVVKDVPADICATCGEEYLAEDTGRRVSQLFDDMSKHGVESRCPSV